MEYWITEDSVIYCDGDASVDVPNHEMVAMIHAAQLVIDEAESSSSESIGLLFDGLNEHGLEAIDGTLAQYFNDRTDDLFKCGLISQQQYDDWFEWIVSDLGIGRDLLTVATGCSRGTPNDVDARKFAIAQWNWIWFAKDYATCRQIDQKTSERLYDALFEIYEGRSDADIRQTELVIETLFPSKTAFIKARRLEFYELVKEELISRGI